MGSALRRGQEPIYPVEQGAQVSDPLVQALTLTAIVIGLGTISVLLSLVYQVYATHGAIDQPTLGEAEREAEHSAEEEEMGR